MSSLVASGHWLNCARLTKTSRVSTTPSWVKPKPLFCGPGARTKPTLRYRLRSCATLACCGELSATAPTTMPLVVTGSVWHEAQPTWPMIGRLATSAWNATSPVASLAPAGVVR